MSGNYQRFGDEGTDAQADASLELDIICDGISDDLTTIRSNVSFLEKSLGLIATPREPSALRDQIRTTEQQTSHNVRSVTDRLRQANSIRCQDGSKLIRIERLQGEFRSLVERYSKVQKDIIQTIRNAPPRGGAPSARAGAAGGGGDPLSGEGSTPAGAQQVQVQLDDDTDYALQQQREREMQGLEAQTIQVQEIFSQLHTMVHDQGTIVESIERHVEQAASSVDTGHRNLQSAERHSSRHRKTCFIVWAVIIVILVILALVLYLQLK